MLIADYAILLLMIATYIVLSFNGSDTTNCAVVLGAWIAQIAVSSGFYYWKAKAENMVKMLHALPEDMKERTDINAVLDDLIGGAK